MKHLPMADENKNLLNVKVFHGYSRIRVSRIPNIYHLLFHLFFTLQCITSTLAIPSARIAKSTESGQVIRLRGSDKYGEGRVEVLFGGRWGLICDSHFSLDDANVICRQLGFTRGANQAHTDGVFGFGGLRNFAVNGLHCVGSEPNVFECPRTDTVRCDYKTQSAGVTCRLDYPSKCAPGDIYNSGWCYHFHEEDKTFEDASQVCRSTGGSLAVITDREQHFFISEAIFTKHINRLRWWVGATKSSSRGWSWIKDIDVTATSYTNWRPGLVTDLGNCMVLRHNAMNLLERDFYYWDTSDCAMVLPYICQHPPLEIGCVVGPGTSYAGSANTTRNGYACEMWNSPAILRRGSFTGIVFPNQVTWQHNYCRNPDGDTAPWCMINANQYDLCDIPSCNSRNEMPRCEANQVQCGTSSQCVARDFLCDYEADCDNGFDELNCTDYVQYYIATPTRKLLGGIAEQWVHIPHVQGCARRCNQTQHFDCVAFSYTASNKICLLANGRLGTTVTLVSDSSSTYYELPRPLSLFCDNTTSFLCDGGICLPRSKMCDGRRDCVDGADEMKCAPAMAVRLMDGRSSNEGRLEVRIGDRWGMICDDQWDIQDANVACRMLRLGDAKRATVASEFGHNGSLSFLMDETSCTGEETDFSQCTFHSQHDCSLDEAAGVVCGNRQSDCTTQQFECGDGICIDNTWLCDGENDCQNGADENVTLCQTPLRVRLVNGDELNSGRVEVQYFGTWGTVCDDNFDEHDAVVVCKMMGIPNPYPIVHQGARFSAGSGPIWLDDVRCDGRESSLSECTIRRIGYHDCDHSEDVGVTCATAPMPLPAVNSGECGIRYVDVEARDPRKPVLARVVGGFETLAGAYPWTAAIRMKERSNANITSHVCGATIINEFWVLTAAHCFGLITSTQRRISDFVVVVGDWDNKMDEGNEQYMDIVNLYQHPNYETILQDDIALIQVVSVSTSGKRSGIQFTEYIQPICLPAADTPYRAGMNCVVSGWGTLEAAIPESYPRRMQAASLPIIDRVTCAHDSVYGKVLSDTAFCAGFLTGGKDACQGDSGGPFACQINGRFQILGVISWGEACAATNKPGIYTKVSDYLDWINRVTSR